MSATLTAQPKEGATAQEVIFDDLKGRSIVAEHWIQEDNFIVEEDGRRHAVHGARFKLADTIYVSQAGRTFHQTQFFDINPGFEHDFKSGAVRPEASEILSFAPGKGFVYRQIPGDPHRGASYLVVVTIRVTRSGAGFACSIDRARILKKGETEYSEYIDKDHPKRYKIVLAQRVYKQDCKVTDGNVFARD